MRTRKMQRAILALAILLPLTGCVERTLMVRSEPPGAAVVLNGRAVGVTPVEVPFLTYGIYDVALSAPQHQRLRAEAPVHAPWFQQVPVDFFFETLWPFTLHDRHEISFTLAPILRADEAGVAEREALMREHLESGVAPADARAKGE